MDATGMKAACTIIILDLTRAATSRFQVILCYVLHIGSYSMWRACKAGGLL